MTAARQDRCRKRGFSLVELLVVIGIIAVLISFLMPAISRAQENASRTKCLATLRNIGMAAQLHANEHQGYFPTAGLQWNCVGTVCNSRGLQDEARRKYDYYSDQGTLRPVPITVALGAYLGAACRTNSRETLTEDMARPELRKLFHCPSQQVDRLGWTQACDGEDTWTAPDEFSSYVFNEALLGRREPPTTDQYPRGLVSKVTNPSRVALAADGRPRDQQSERFLLFFNRGEQDTLATFEQYILTSNLGKDLLDFARHDQRMNVAFVDGHAESFSMGIPPAAEGGELDQVYVSRGIAH